MTHPFHWLFASRISLGLIEQMMDETGTRGELTRATHDRFAEAYRRYGKDAGEMSVCRLIEEDAEVSLRVAGDWVAPWGNYPTGRLSGDEANPRPLRRRSRRIRNSLKNKN